MNHWPVPTPLHPDDASSRMRLPGVTGLRVQLLVLLGEWHYLDGHEDSLLYQAAAYMIHPGATEADYVRLVCAVGRRKGFNDGWVSTEDVLEDLPPAADVRHGAALEQLDDDVNDTLWPLLVGPGVPPCRACRRTRHQVWRWQADGECPQHRGVA